MKFKNKRIFLIIHEGALGGAQRQALGLGKYLTEELNCSVYVLLTYSGDTTVEFKNYARECGIKEILFFAAPYLLVKKELSYRNLKRVKWTIQYIFKITQGVNRYKPDYLIPFLNFPSKVSFFIYKLVPSVKFTFWHQLGLDSFSKDLMECIAVKNIPCFIGNAPNCLEAFKNDYFIEPEKMHLLPQQVSLKYIEKDKIYLRKKFGVPTDSVVIGMIAHYRKDKYQEILLNVFEKITAEHFNTYLIFLGNSRNNSSSKEKFLFLNKEVEKRNLGSKVTILDNEDIHEVLNILDIGVLFSLIEGTPNAVMEYMLYGLPVIASDHPGCQGLLQDSEFLVKNEESVIHKKILRLVADPLLRKLEGDRNILKIKGYDVKTYVEKLEAIISGTLKQ